ncbi:MAG: glycosyltransferase family 39 protein [Saprospiraceae bacterium]|nr:glycosyltransferase family 39 protein [Saprospiraceae bacterium]
MTTGIPSFIQVFFYDGKFHKLFLVLFSFLLYVNTLGHEFVLDDGIVITENKFVKSGISGISNILTKDSFYGFFKKEGKEKLVAGGRYRPMSLIFFAILYQLFGEDSQIFHFFSILAYGLLGLIIYSTLKSLLKNYDPSFGMPLAFVTSLIFIAHPIHTECVANIKGLDEILALLFSMLSFYFSLRYFDSQKLTDLLFSGALLLFGLLSKENAISYVFIIPCASYLIYNQKNKSLFWLSASLCLATIIFVIMRSNILGFNPFSTVSKELMNNPFLKYQNGIATPMDFGEKFGIIGYTLYEYIRLLFFPHPLTHDYYPKQIPTLGLWSIQSILCYLCYSMILFYAWIKRNINPEITISALCFMLPLGLVSNILFPIGTNMGERFLFMPSLGFSIFISYLLFKYFRLKLNIIFYILCPLILGYAIATFVRNPAWHDNETLFKTDAKTSVNSAKIHNGIAGILLEKVPEMKDTAAIRSITNIAKKELDIALKIHPLYMEANLQLGNVYFFNKNYDEAILQYNKVLKSLPEDEDAFKNLQYALREKGRQIAMLTGNVPLAKDYLKQSLGMNPDDVEATMLMGIAEGSTGNTEEAIKYFQKVLVKEPKNAQAYFNLGITYKNANQITKSDSFFNQAFMLDSKIYEKNGADKK